MERKFFFIALICFFSNCTDSYRIKDRTGKHCVTFFVKVPTTAGSGETVKLYFDNTHTASTDPHIRLRWSNIEGVAINWNTRPIKIRSYLVRFSSLDTSLYDVKSDYTEEEKMKVRDTTQWQYFDLVEVVNGKYTKCQ
jgi:hypothetical protein